MLDHQLAQLRERQEAEDVVVGRVQEVPLAAGDLPDGHGALHPLLPGGSRGGHHPVLAVHRLVDRTDHRGDHGAQSLFDEIQPDVGPAGALGPGAHLVPVVGAPVQLHADLHGLREGNRPRRGIGRLPLVTCVTWGQLEPSRAHPRTAFRSPTNDQGRVLREREPVQPDAQAHHSTPQHPRHLPAARIAGSELIHRDWTRRVPGEPGAGAVGRPVSPAGRRRGVRS